MAEEKKEAASADLKKEKVPAKKAAKVEKGPLVYVGPTLKGTILRTFKIFADGVPAEYQENAVARGLFVSPEKLNEAKAEIGKTGSRLNVFYRQAANYGLKPIAKGGK